MADMQLPSNPTLADLQEYVAEMVRQRGFSEESVGERFMLLAEEVGEFAKSARKHTSLKIDQSKKLEDEAALEAADVLIVLLGICNMLSIDLEKGFREKEAINHGRTWS
ncbi:RS21-C6 protein [Candidatus Saccharibacteria bacterium]|nr:RS21-C6 protein [Candidatus Saccharibacteria bacterium]